MNKKKNNYNPVVSVHNEDDLKFQQYQFDHRIGRNNYLSKTMPQLSTRFFNSTYSAKDLTTVLGDKIRKAGRVLREQR